MAYGNDATELVVASSGSIHVAPVGTALPTSESAALNAAFVDLGYATEDGVSLSVSPDIAEFMAWQSRQAVRRELTTQEITLSFSLEQWNANSIVLAFGGGEVTTPTAGHYRYDFPAEGDALDERTLVVDWEDGDRNFRIVVARGNVTDAVDTTVTRGQLAVLPIAFKALQPDDGSATAYILSDDHAFGTGS